MGPRRSCSRPYGESQLFTCRCGSAFRCGICTVLGNEDENCTAAHVRGQQLTMGSRCNMPWCLAGRIPLWLCSFTNLSSHTARQLAQGVNHAC